TDSFSVSDHYQVLEEHVKEKLFNYVVANNNIATNGAVDSRFEPVMVDRNGVADVALVAADVISEENRYHHDTSKLASLLMELYYQRREGNGPVVTLTEPQEATVL
ncbi:MAG: hypothetical protein J4N95_07185, partial [Chloroflexi bacterium]|nr:hypothetical protein [Chloroflexota bacterium]